MLAFRIEINGQPVCTASSEGVATAIATIKGEQCVGGAAPPELNISAGTIDPEIHATWLNQSLAVGDLITIEVVDVAASVLTKANTVRELNPDFVETERRAYYERLKVKYEREPV